MKTVRIHRARLERNSMRAIAAALDRALNLLRELRRNRHDTGYDVLDATHTAR